MDPLDITIVGPGRAGMALALAASRAGHRIISVVGRDRERTAAAADLVSASARLVGDEPDGGDLLVIAVRDAAITPAAASLGDTSGFTAAVHLSGFTPVAALAPLEAMIGRLGSFHPLQTLPNAAVGAGRLAGAHIAVTADEPLRGTLHELAVSLGSVPFDLADDAKALYHAAAAAAANFPLASLTMASDLFAAAGVPFDAARPLVEAVVANAFDLGPRAALTGPVARGDEATVAGQLGAVEADAPEWRAGFVAFVRELARISGRSGEFAALVDAPRPEGTG